MLTAREYTRVSSDKSGRARSVQEQHKDNAAAAERHGLSLNGEAYSDVSVSASRYSTKVRGGFARLLADLKAGRFGADVLVLWESSRGSRRVGEWATLVDLLEDQGVKVHVTTHGRTYDPANARDRRSLMEDAVDSEYESGKTSARTRRAAAENAARGEPYGRVPFGYIRVYDPVSRRLVAQQPDPERAQVIRELFARLRSGHSLRSIAADFEQRGIRAASGKVFVPSHLRDMALTPVYGGLRVHGNATRRSLDGAVPGTWPALVDAETFHAVRALLLDPSRRTSRPGRAKHLLSLIAVCDLCGGPLTVTYRYSTDREYACKNKGCVRTAADELDRYAEEAMLKYLARPDVIASLRKTPEEGGGELSKVRADLAEARSELTSLRSAARAGKVTTATLIAVEPGHVTRVETLEARERELITPPALSVIPPGKDVARRWKPAPISAKRQVARLLLSPALLGQMRVGKAAKPGHRGDPAERVRWASD